MKTPQLLLACAIASLASAPARGQEATRYMVVVTGTEILAGAFADGHTLFLTQTLRPLGLQCVGSMTVDDGQDDIREALAYAVRRTPLVIVTGGLGPTDNDVTCEAISAFTGIAVQEHPDALADLARRMATPVEGLRANLRRQVRVPLGGSWLKNVNGTAVGLVFETANGAIVALPGPPRELQPMVVDELVPYLARRFGTRRPGISLTVRFVGLGQSAIDERMKARVPLPDDVVLASQFDGTRVDFTFSLAKDDPQHGRQLEDLRKKMLAEFPENIYATDPRTTLENVVIDLLKARGARLVLAEMASGGAVESALSAAQDNPAPDDPDAADRKVLAGGYVAPDYQTLSRLAKIPADAPETPEDDARRMKQLAGLLSAAADRQWAVVVGPRLPDTRGSAHTLVAICRPGADTVVMPLPVRGNDPLSRARLATQVVDQLRKELVKE
ncbi:MAG: competence/damage-inducible protein A [Thermoguttaceae bacterium]